MGFGLKNLLEPDQGLFPNDESYALANPGGYVTAKTRANRTGSGTGGVGQGVLDSPLPVDTLLTSGGMPSLTDSDRRNASRKARAAMLSRGGRASTILTEDPLGGGL